MEIEKHKLNSHQRDGDASCTKEGSDENENGETRWYLDLHRNAGQWACSLY